MGLGYAVDQLYATGWSDLDSAGCAHDADGRAYPSVARVEREFEQAGFVLSIRHVTAFDCYRAQWHAPAAASGGPVNAGGAVVGQSEAEAAVYALAQLRRSLASAGA